MAQSRQRSKRAASTEESASNGEQKHDPPVWSRKMWTGSATIEVAVFTHEVSSDNGGFTVYNVTAKRTYKKGENYHHAAGFRSEDIPTLIQVLGQAYSFIAHEQSKPTEQ